MPKPRIIRDLHYPQPIFGVFWGGEQSNLRLTRSDMNPFRTVYVQTCLFLPGSGAVLDSGAFRQVATGRMAGHAHVVGISAPSGVVRLV